MARGFQRSRRGEIRAKLDVHERGMLIHLFGEVHDLLDGGGTTDSDPLAAMVGIGTATEAPADPALARLLPDAHRDDAEASADFRRYTEVGLRERKRTGLDTARRTLERDGTLVLDDAEAQAWVVALTDVRLVIAERLGVRTDDDHDRLLQDLAHAEDPSSEQTRGLETMLDLYDWLTWLQDGLVGSLTAHLDADPPRPSPR